MLNIYFFGEDNTSARLLQRVLNGCDCQMHRVEPGGAPPATRPDLFILDMPQRNLILHLRVAYPRVPQIAIVMDDTERLPDCDVVLGKPLDVTNFVEKLNTLLSAGV